MERAVVSVWVGWLQLDEYDESISVHDPVDWEVRALAWGDGDDRLRDQVRATYELDRYAGVMGDPLFPLAGRVAALHAVVPGPSSNDGGGLVERVTTSGPLLSTDDLLRPGRNEIPSILSGRGHARPDVWGFVVDVDVDVVRDGTTERATPPVYP